MSRRSLGVTAAGIFLAVSLIVSLALAQAGDTLPPEPGDATAELLANKAVEFAKLNGGTSPAEATVVLTNRNAASDLFSPGSVAGSDEEVYVVEMTGKFIGEMAKLPDGAETPTGEALWFGLDPLTGEVTDWGISVSPVDLARLGEVSTLDLTKEA